MGEADWRRKEKSAPSRYADIYVQVTADAIDASALIRSSNDDLNACFCAPREPLEKGNGLPKFLDRCAPWTQVAGASTSSKSSIETSAKLRLNEHHHAPHRRPE
jgi:hypothetical protein